MRNRSESPMLMLGAAAVGFAAGLLLDGERGARRREQIGESLSSVGETAYDSASEWASSLSETLSNAAASVSDGVSHAGESASETAHDGWDATRDAISSLSHSLLGGALKAGTTVAAMSNPVAGALAHLLHRKTKWEKLRDSARNQFDRLQPSSVNWKDVSKAVDNIRPTATAPVIGGGTALVILGSAAYLLLLSPNAEERRRKLGEQAGKLIGDVGNLARMAGARTANGPDQGEGQDWYKGEQSARTANRPEMIARQVRAAVAEVTTNRSDITVLNKDGVIYLQGTAAPEEYDRIVEQVQGITSDFVNELQAVSV